MGKGYRYYHELGRNMLIYKTKFRAHGFQSLTRRRRTIIGLNFFFYRPCFSLTKTRDQILRCYWLMSFNKRFNSGRMLQAKRVVLVDGEISSEFIGRYLHDIHLMNSEWFGEFEIGFDTYFFDVQK